MTTLIDPDQHEELGLAAAHAAADVPFPIWLKAWIPRHRVAAGALAAAASVVFALALLTIFGFSATPNVPPVWPADRVVKVETQNAAHETSAVIRRDRWDDGISRGEMFGGEPFTAEQLAGISVTVEGPNATCRILIDNRVVDEASVPAEGGLVTCMWVAPTR